MAPLPELLTSAEVAGALRTTRGTIARWVEKGQLQAVRLPSGVLRFRRSDVEALLAEPVDEVAS